MPLDREVKSKLREKVSLANKSNVDEIIAEVEAGDSAALRALAYASCRGRSSAGGASPGAATRARLAAERSPMRSKAASDTHGLRGAARGNGLEDAAEDMRPNGEVVGGMHPPGQHRGLLDGASGDKWPPPGGQNQPCRSQRHAAASCWQPPDPVLDTSQNCVGVEGP